MNDSNPEVSLLREICDSQVKQTEAVVQAMRHIQTTQKAYMDWITAYRLTLEDYRKTEEERRKDVPILTIIMAAIFTVIALCMIANLVLQPMAK